MRFGRHCNRYRLQVRILDFVIVKILNKHTDTGRAEIWPIVLAYFYASGRTLLGGGFGAYLGSEDLTQSSVDNGYLDTFIEFGYIGSLLCL